MMQRTAWPGALLTAGILFVSLLISSLPAAAQGSRPAGVYRSVETLRMSMIRADKAKLDELLSPKLSFGHSNGVVQDKGGFIKAVLTQEEVFRAIKLTDQRVTFNGDMAVVRQTFIADILLKGKALSVKLGEVQIWQNKDGKWQLIARQAFKA